MSTSLKIEMSIGTQGCIHIQHPVQQTHCVLYTTALFEERSNERETPVHFEPEGWVDI